MAIAEQLGNFKLLEVLGEGGQAAVYKALDTTLERPVAIKILSPELKRRKLEFARFEREAKLASSLDHPNICTIYGLFEDKGYHFIAMQYVEGENLHDLVRDRPLELKSALSIAVQVAEALAVAHEQNIVHRDIKPRNVMVTDAGRVLVLDFGLAKMLDEDENGDENVRDLNAPIAGSAHEDFDSKIADHSVFGLATDSPAAVADIHLTTQGEPYGTPASSAPEMALGAPSDRRADVFSIGVLLYFLLTGKFPFLAGTVADVRDKIVNEAPVPVAEARGASQPIPPGLANIVNRALEKNPEKRFQTAAELRDQLTAILRETEETWNEKTATQFPAFAAASQPYFALPRPLSWQSILTVIAALAVTAAAILLFINRFSS